MFKKTLAAAAILGAFAGSAFAADVTLYGAIDYALTYQHQSTDGKADVDTLKMVTGQNTGNRWGLKGTEDLGNGMNVGFQLESGFNADDGTLDNDGRLFGREARLFVNGAFGEVAFGRMGQLASGNGTYALFSGAVSPFGTGWGDAAAGHTAVFAGGYARMDNMITYKTPTFAGFTVYAQYSFDNSVNDNTLGEEKDPTHGTEGQADVNRYYGIGATYKAGNLNLVAIVDSINYASAPGVKTQYKDDSIQVNVGGAYDFGVVKAYLAANYADNVTSWGKVAGAKWSASGTVGGYAAALEGFGVNAGVDVPAFGGTAKFSVGYGKAEQNEVASGDKPEAKFYAATAGYVYKLSKRTTVYSTVDYAAVDYNAAATEGDTDTYGVTVGMVHTF